MAADQGYGFTITKENNMKNKFKAYPKNEVFRIIDTMGIPHTYSLSAKHLYHAKNYFDGKITDECIKDLEEKEHKGCCKMKGCDLRYDQHGLALVVEVNYTGDVNEAPGLQGYLESCLDQMSIDGATGFVFKQK
jgi:hypothetical protein